jgi:hypothetical protein
VEGSSMRTQDFGPQGLQVSRSRGWLWERLNVEPCPSYITELWRLLGLAVTDQSTDNNPTADALHAIARRMLGVMNSGCSSPARRRTWRPQPPSSQSSSRCRAGALGARAVLRAAWCWCYRLKWLCAGPDWD